jgi:hypothetical protein
MMYPARLTQKNLQAQHAELSVVYRFEHLNFEI